MSKPNAQTPYGRFRRQQRELVQRFFDGRPQTMFVETRPQVREGSRTLLLNVRLWQTNPA